MDRSVIPHRWTSATCSSHFVLDQTKWHKQQHSN